MDSGPAFLRFLLGLWAALLIINGVLDFTTTRGDRTTRLLAGIVLAIGVAVHYSYTRGREDR